MNYNLNLKKENGRGVLTNKIQELSKEILGREINTIELRFLPFLDYTLKNFNKLEKNEHRSKVNDDEKTFICELEEKGFVLWQADKIMVTKKFYDFMQEVLWESYVELYLGEKNEKE